jgi:hypothetical protein
MYAECYLRSDAGLGPDKIMYHERIMDADMTFYQTIISDKLLQHVQPIAKEKLNSYYIDTAEYIVHFPGGKPKHLLLRHALDSLTPDGVKKEKLEPLPLEALNKPNVKEMIMLKDMFIGPTRLRRR